MNKFNKEQKLVILGSSLGTLFEWYDFFLYIRCKCKDLNGGNLQKIEANY